MRTDKSVVLPLVFLGSTSYQVQQLKDKVAEIQANSGAFWRFLCFEIGFLLSSLSQLSLRLHLTWVAWMFFLWIGTEFFLRCGSRTATARNQRLESRSSTGKLWPVALDFSESRLHATEKTLRRVTIWNGLFEMYARIVQRGVFWWGAAAQRQACWSWGGPPHTCLKRFHTVVLQVMLAVHLSNKLKQLERQSNGVKCIQMLIHVKWTSHGSRNFKISQSFFSTKGTTCLSDYCCFWTASTRAGEPEKPILCRGRGLFDKIAWNSMKSSCSKWERTSL